MHDDEIGIESHCPVDDWLTGVHRGHNLGDLAGVFDLETIQGTGVVRDIGDP